jgi:hypothetical protein
MSRLLNRFGPAHPEPLLAGSPAARPVLGRAPRRRAKAARYSEREMRRRKGCAHERPGDAAADGRREARVETFADAWAAAERDAGDAAAQPGGLRRSITRRTPYVVYRAALEREHQAAVMLAAGAEAHR